MASSAVAQLVVLLGEAYRQSVSKATIEAYAAGLDGLSDDVILAAGMRALARCKFMPTPAEIRELAGVGESARSLAAWGDVQRAIPLGPYRSINFRDPLINAAVRSLGGWPAAVGEMDSGGREKWYRHNFLKAYETLAASGADGEVCRPLTGISEVTIVKGEVVPAIPVAIACDPARRKLSTEVVRGAIAAPASRERIEIPKVEFKQA